MSSAVEPIRQAVDLLVDGAARLHTGWIVAALVLHLLAEVVRVRGWWNILRTTYPGCTSLRPRDVRVSYFAGAGFNGVLPARGGDIVKLAFLRRRIPGSSYATLAATSIPESAFESTCGALLVVWVLARGFLPIPLTPGELPALDVSFCLQHPIAAAAIAALVAVAAFALVRWMRGRWRGVASRVRRGLAILGQPRRFLRGVVVWQAIGRVIRLGSLACFLVAFDLPATAQTALLVMAAQGGGRIIPIAPVSAGLRVAMLGYGLTEITGQAIDPAAITVFTVGVSALLFATMLSISLVVVGRELGVRSPRAVLRVARRRATAPASAPA